MKIIDKHIEETPKRCGWLFRILNEKYTLCEVCGEEVLCLRREGTGDWICDKCNLNENIEHSIPIGLVTNSSNSSIIKEEYCINEPVEVALKDFGKGKGKVIGIEDKINYDADGIPYSYTNYLIEFNYKRRKLQKKVPHSLNNFNVVFIRSLL